MVDTPITNPILTDMSVYSPTNAAPVEDVEKFYDDLNTAIHHVPAHDFLVILGDFNARLGPEDTPFTYHNNTNCNGKLQYLPCLWKTSSWPLAPCFVSEWARDGSSRTKLLVRYVSWTTYW